MGSKYRKATLMVEPIFLESEAEATLMVKSSFLETEAEHGV